MDDQPTITGTAFRSLTDPKGRPRRWTFDGFAEKIRSPRPMPPGGKDALPLWSPATFTDHTRGKGNYIQASAIVVDVDSNPDRPAGDLARGVPDCGPRVLEAILAQALPGAQYIAHTTAGSTPGAYRSRVIIFTSRPVSWDEYQALAGFIRVQAMRAGFLGFEADTTWTQPERAWFTPAQIPDYACFHSDPTKSTPLDVDAILGTGINWVRAAEEQRAQMIREIEHADWEEPTPLIPAPTLPRIPLEGFPPAISEFVRAVAKSTNTPEDLGAMLALGVCALALSKAMLVGVRDDWACPVNLYTATAMRPGSGKSPVFSKFLAPVRSFESANTEKWAPIVAERAEKRAQLEAQMHAARKNPAHSEKGLNLARELEALPPLHTPRLTGSDSTPEKLAVLMAQNAGRFAVVSDEGGPLEAFNGRYTKGAPNLDIYMQAWEGSHDIHVDRMVRESVVVKKPALTFILAVQPAVLERFGASRILAGKGLPQRFLYCIPLAPMALPRFDVPPIPAAVTSAYDTLLKKLLRRHPCTPGLESPEPHLIRLSIEAKALFGPYWEDLQARCRGDLLSIAEWAHKRGGDTCKIAAIIEAATNPDNLSAEVSEKSMGAAISIMDVLIAHGQYAHGLMGLDPKTGDAKRLLEGIIAGHAEKDRDGFTPSRALAWVTGPLRKVPSVRAALSVLEDHNYVQRVPTPKSGKPGRPRADRWLLNPRALETPSQNSQNSQK